MSERKMASIRSIDRIDPIDGADAIEVATVGGWKIVVKKGEFFPGDLAVYCEIDSWIPHERAPFLSKGKEPREYKGVKGERLRTVKLRGQISQGLLLPMSCLTNYGADLNEGDDVTEVLNIQKWEAEIPAQLSGQVKGNFPTQIPKTDQERVQNLVKEIQESASRGDLFEVTEKLEGSSMTCYLIDGEFGVCSRNLDLKRDENNSFWKVAIALDIETKMRSLGFNNFAVQGELIGPGVQGNIYGLSNLDFYVYDFYRIKFGEYLLPEIRRGWVERLGLKHVPVLAVSKDLGVGTVDELLSWAEGKSELNPKQEREGIVFKSEDSEFSFKAISNKYLIKQG